MSLVIEYEDPREWLDTLFAHDLVAWCKPCWMPHSEWWRTPLGSNQLQGAATEAEKQASEGILREAGLVIQRLYDKPLAHRSIAHRGFHG